MTHRDPYYRHSPDYADEEARDELRMGHVRLDECADGHETKGQPLYKRISAKIQKLSELAAEREHIIKAYSAEMDALRANVTAANHRQVAAEYRAQRIVLDAELKAHAKAAEGRIAALEVERKELQKEIAIHKLAVPLEEELSVKIDDALRYLAMGQGFTLNGIARLFMECQRRIAADWSDVGDERRRAKAAEADRDTARRERDEAREQVGVQTQTVAECNRGLLELRAQRSTLITALREICAVEAKYSPRECGQDYAAAYDVCQEVAKAALTQAGADPV